MPDYPSLRRGRAAQRHVVIISLHADPVTAAGAAEGGGTHSYLRELLAMLPPRGWRCTVLTRWASKSVPQEQRLSSHSRVERLRIGKIEKVDKRALDDLHIETVKAIRRALRKGPEPTLLHSVYWNSGRAAAEVSSELEVPFVHTVISNGRRRALEHAADNAARRIAVEQFVFFRAARIFCVSPEERDDLQSLYSIESDKLLVVGRPVDAAFLLPAHDEVGMPVLGGPWPAAEHELPPSAHADTAHWWLRRAFTYVGRMDEAKGVGTILRAYANLASRYPHCPSLWLVGGLPLEIDRLRSEYADLVGQLEQARRIEWWGYQAANAISGLLLRSVALVTHSRYEPGGRVVLEALAAGIPVIATPHGFARDLVSDWVTGFSVPFGDAALLEHRMEHFIRQPLLRNALGIRAKQAAADALNVWRFIDVHCNVYDMVSGRPAPTIISGELPQLPPPNELFDRQDILPTYPVSERLPSELEVIAFASFATRLPQRELSLITLTMGSSLFWRIECGDRRWLVKHPRVRLETRHLWDPRDGTSLAQTSSRRYKNEAYAASLPQFAPVLALDDQQRLLLRTEYPRRIWANADVIAQVGVLRQLHSVATASPTPETDLQSLEAAWARVLGSATVTTILDMSVISGFADLATSAPERSAVCHGAPHRDHFVDIGAGAWRLLDGDHLYTGTPERDLAYYLLDVAEFLGTDAEEWAALLRATCSDGFSLPQTVSALALLTVEGLWRHSVLLRRSHYARYEAHWKRLQQTVMCLGITL